MTKPHQFLSIDDYSPSTIVYTKDILPYLRFNWVTNVTPENAFGTTIRELRTKKNLSQETLALNSNLDRTFISLLERGLRQPSLSTIFQISSTLDVSASELIHMVSEKLDYEIKQDA